MAGKTVDIASTEAKGGSKEEGSKYERSTIEFPYGDLDDAFAVADAIHANAGAECSVDQLAAYLDQSARSGAFRLRLSTARIFGLIETEKGTVSLTPLGRQAADPTLRPRAGVQAFLTVPLYREVYEKYRGHHLPPAAALEREMGNLGVAKKQTPKARQAFERSAEQGGFFKLGRERLVEPTFKGSRDVGPPPKEPTPPKQNSGGGGGGSDLHPFIQGLLDTLPPPRTPWPASERQKWLSTAEHIFSLLYGADSEAPSRGDDAG